MPGSRFRLLAMAMATCSIGFVGAGRVEMDDRNDLETDEAVVTVSQAPAESRPKRRISDAAEVERPNRGRGGPHAGPGNKFAWEGAPPAVPGAPAWDPESRTFGWQTGGATPAGMDVREVPDGYAAVYNVNPQALPVGQHSNQLLRRRATLLLGPDVSMNVILTLYEEFERSGRTFKIEALPDDATLFSQRQSPVWEEMANTNFIYQYKAEQLDYKIQRGGFPYIHDLGTVPSLTECEGLCNKYAKGHPTVAIYFDETHADEFLRYRCYGSYRSILSDEEVKALPQEMGVTTSVLQDPRLRSYDICRDRVFAVMQPRGDDVGVFALTLGGGAGEVYQARTRQAADGAGASTKDQEADLIVSGINGLSARCDGEKSPIFQQTHERPPLKQAWTEMHRQVMQTTCHASNFRLYMSHLYEKAKYADLLNLPDAVVAKGGMDLDSFIRGWDSGSFHQAALQAKVAIKNAFAASGPLAQWLDRFMPEAMLRGIFAPPFFIETDCNDKAELTQAPAAEENKAEEAWKQYQMTQALSAARENRDAVQACELRYRELESRYGQKDKEVLELKSRLSEAERRILDQDAEMQVKQGRIESLEGLSASLQARLDAGGGSAAAAEVAKPPSAGKGPPPPGQKGDGKGGKGPPPPGSKGAEPGAGKAAGKGVPPLVPGAAAGAKGGGDGRGGKGGKAPPPPPGAGVAAAGRGGPPMPAGKAKGPPGAGAGAKGPPAQGPSNKAQINCEQATRQLLEEFYGEPGNITSEGRTKVDVLLKLNRDQLMGVDPDKLTKKSGDNAPAKKEVYEFPWLESPRLFSLGVVAGKVLGEFKKTSTACGKTDIVCLLKLLTAGNEAIVGALEATGADRPYAPEGLAGILVGVTQDELGLVEHDPYLGNQAVTKEVFDSTFSGVGPSTQVINAVAKMDKLALANQITTCLGERYQKYDEVQSFQKHLTDKQQYYEENAPKYLVHILEIAVSQLMGVALPAIISDEFKNNQELKYFETRCREKATPGGKQPWVAERYRDGVVPSEWVANVALNPINMVAARFKDDKRALSPTYLDLLLQLMAGTYVPSSGKLPHTGNGNLLFLADEACGKLLTFEPVGSYQLSANAMLKTATEHQESFGKCKKTMEDYNAAAITSGTYKFEQWDTLIAESGALIAGLQEVVNKVYDASGAIVQSLVRPDEADPAGKKLKELAEDYVADILKSGAPKEGTPTPPHAFAEDLTLRNTLHQFCTVMKQRKGLINEWAGIKDLVA